MQLDVPFYINSGDGNQCYQVAMQSVLRYFLNKEFTLPKLDRLTRRKTGLWTYTSQIVPPLYDLGLEVRYFSSSPLESVLGGESYIKDHFGKDAEKILKFTDVPVVVYSVRNLLKYNLFEKKTLKLSQIEKEITEGHLPMVLLDWNKIIKGDDFFTGHMGVLTGFDRENIYFHHSGPTKPQPNMKIPKKLFLEAWNANGTDNDIVIVYGIRHRT